MAQVPDVDAIIAALGAPPRSFPTEMTANLPRSNGKTGPAIFAFLFGTMAAGIALLSASGLAGSSRDSMAAPGVVGVLLIGAGAGLIRMRNRIRSTCRDALTLGHATEGIVASLDARRIGATVRDSYEFGYADTSGKRHVLKAFWTDPSMRVGQGARVVVLYDPRDPKRAAVVPLDYPDLKLKATASAQDSDAEMIATLARLGVPLDFGISTPSAALFGGVLKAGLFQGVKKIEAGRFNEAVDGLSAVLGTAAGDPAFTKVHAVVHAQRGLAHERLGSVAEAHADFESALRLDPGQALATEGLRRLATR